jgi:NAD(P)-dependent dehydrogenase (short-subunit alcohol dehydrogenase family)
MTSQENIYVVLILQGRRALLLELQQARERAPRPHEVFGAVQATSDRLDILINNAGIGTASPRQTSAEEFETEPWPVGNFRRRPGHRDPSG